MANSIFQPRQAFDKNGVQIDYVTPVGIKEFDKYYIKTQIKYVPVPVSEGSEDYVLDIKVLETKEDIDEVINSQAPDVGLEAMLEKFNRTGDPSVLPQPVQATDDIIDFTKLPQDGAEYFEYIHGLAAAYEKLPIELRKDMSMSDFVKNITDKQVNDYLQSVKPVEKGENDG